jgi:AcrR family transcriptional regulator
VTVTPWGHADRLRSRQLRPGPGASREAVERNQRERLLGGMVASVARLSYEETRVADVLEVSGVSRNAFYKLFANKQDCFVATVEATLAMAMERAAAAYQQGGPWSTRLGRAFDLLVELIISQPAAARLCFVDIYAAGPEAVDVVDRKARELERMVMAAFDESPERAGMPRELVRAGLGGLRKIARTRLRRGTEGELAELAPGLLEWALSYRTPPRVLRRPRNPPPLPPPPANDDDPRERILIGFDAAVAEKGYPAVTLADVARHAAISLSTFYAHFESKEEAMLASLGRGAVRARAAILPSYQAAESWPYAVGVAFHQLFAFIATEPAMAMIGGVDAYAGGPQVLERRDQLNEAAQGFLARGFREHPDTNPVMAEAIASSVDALLFERLRSKGAERMYEAAPQATFLALVPFVGVDTACTVANAGGSLGPGVRRTAYSHVGDRSAQRTRRTAA